MPRATGTNICVMCHRSDQTKNGHWEIKYMSYRILFYFEGGEEKI